MRATQVTQTLALKERGASLLKPPRLQLGGPHSGGP
jgi:hypothetical protein